MRLLIDGAHCPLSVQQLCRRLGTHHRIEVIIFNPVERIEDIDDAVLKQTVLETGVVNDVLSDNAALHDLVVTSHIPLANKVLERVTAVLHPDGYIMNRAGIDYLLYERHLEIEDRKQGIAKGLKKRREEENRSFEHLLLSYISGINTTL